MLTTSNSRAVADDISFTINGMKTKRLRASGFGGGRTCCRRWRLKRRICTFPAENAFSYLSSRSSWRYRACQPSALVCDVLLTYQHHFCFRPGKSSLATCPQPPSRAAPRCLLLSPSPGIRARRARVVLLYTFLYLCLPLPPMVTTAALRHCATLRALATHIPALTFARLCAGTAVRRKQLYQRVVVLVRSPATTVFPGILLRCWRLYGTMPGVRLCVALVRATLIFLNGGR